MNQLDETKGKLVEAIMKLIAIKVQVIYPRGRRDHVRHEVTSLISASIDSLVEELQVKELEHLARQAQQFVEVRENGDQDDHFYDQMRIALERLNGIKNGNQVGELGVD